MNNDLKILEEVSNLNAVSGNEDEVREYLNKEFLDLNLEIIKDNLGSICAIKRSKKENAKKVLVVAHMDEVGFIVKKIRNDGLINVLPIGGLNESTLLSSRVVLKTYEGKVFKGSIDSLPPHLNGGSQDIENMLFDFGFTSYEEAYNEGIRSGDQITFDEKFTILNNKRVLSKAIDDRYGIALGLIALKELINEELDYDLYVGGSVQEEVGCRGASTLASLIKPDLAIILDCSPSRDTISSLELGQIGKGVLIRFFDRSMIAFKKLIRYQIDILESNNLKYQYFDSKGGTDAGIIHKSLDGVLTLTHCICARSIHTQSTVMDIEDFNTAKASLLAMLRDLNSEKIEGFKY